MKLKWYRIHWNGGKDISCFKLSSMQQALSIAKQYENVVKVEEKA